MCVFEMLEGGRWWRIDWENTQIRDFQLWIVKAKYWNIFVDILSRQLPLQLEYEGCKGGPTSVEGGVGMWKKCQGVKSMGG